MGRPAKPSARRRRLTKPTKGAMDHGRERQNKRGRPDISPRVRGGLPMEKLQRLKTLVDELILGGSKVTHPAPSEGVSAPAVPETDRGGGALPCIIEPPFDAPHVKIGTGFWKVERDQLVHQAPHPQKRRTRTILLLEGINDRTERPIRCYIRPDDTLVYVETVGQLTYTVGGNRTE